MAIIINDNIEVRAGKPSGSWYLDPNTNAVWLDTATVNAIVPIGYRSQRLVVQLPDGDYWYKDGVANIDLVKKANSSTETIIAGENLVAGNVVYLKTDGKYWKADYLDIARIQTELRYVTASILTNATGDGVILGAVVGVGLTVGQRYCVGVNGAIVLESAIPDIEGIFSRYVGTANSVTELDFHPDSFFAEMTLIPPSGGTTFNPTVDNIGDITAFDSIILDNDTINIFASKTQGQLNAKQNKTNGLVSGGTITVGTFGGLGTNNDIRVAPASWYIAPTPYSTSVNSDFLDIVLSSAGNQRYIGIFGSTTGAITTEEGVSAPLASYPATPLNSIVIGYVLVGDASVSSTPDLTGYLLKSEKALQAANELGANDTTYVTPLANVVKQNTNAKDASGGYVGLTLFKINFKNVLNTFTSFFTNSNTAARTYTFQNRDGTIADDTDLATKLNKAGDVITGDLGNTSTGFFRIPSGTTAQRPATPLDGMRRYNTTTLRDEFYANGLWQNHARLAGDTFTGAIAATNLSGTNTGDNATNTQYSGLAASKENTANKSTTFTGNESSNTLFPTINAVFNWVSGGFATIPALVLKMDLSMTARTIKLNKTAATANGINGSVLDLMELIAGCTDNTGTGTLAAVSTTNTKSIRFTLADAVRGFAGGTDGAVLFVQNVRATLLVLNHEDGVETAANRIVTGGRNLSLGTFGSVILQYKTSNSRWNVIAVFGGVYWSQLAGSGNRAIEVDADGVGSATKAFVNRYITDSTNITNLENNANWSGGVYSGAAIAGETKGKEYFGTTHRYFMTTSTVAKRTAYA